MFTGKKFRSLSSRFGRGRGADGCNVTPSQAPMDVPLANPFQALYRDLKPHLLAAGAFSGLGNILMFSGALFMVQVYDRVLPGHSLATLQVLLLAIIIINALIAGLELIRARVFVSIGHYIHEALRAEAFSVNVCAALNGQPGDGAVVLRDLDQVRQFTSGNGPVTFFDLPWAPLFLIVLFAMHPLLGGLCAAGMGVLIFLTLVAQRSAARHAVSINEHANAASALAEACRRGAGTIVPLGMTTFLQLQWNRHCAAGSFTQQNQTDIAGTYASVSKFVRLSL
jgi:ABC-type protease/lipase transport system fused ATPase/permease subunit